MSRKSLVMLGFIVGSVVGGYVPTFFGVGLLSFTSLFGNAIGGLLGTILAYKLTTDW